MPQIKTNIPSAIGEGNPKIAQKIAMTTPAIKATEIWLPTKAPILETMPSVKALILGLRDAGASRSACPITSGSEIVKYIVKTRMVSAVKIPDIKVFPTPTIPPKAEIKSVPSLVTEFTFLVSESIIP